jgi:hypothetical protein
METNATSTPEGIDDMNKTPTVGSVSTGTMRPADLIPCFLDCVRDFAPDEYAGFMVAAFGPVPAYVADEGDKSEWWDSENAADLLAQLFDILDAAAPEGLTFGAHPGDGADYGFWPVELEG